MMRFAAYALVVSIVYAIVALIDRDLAAELTIAFVAMLLVPGLAHDWRSRHHRPGRS